MSETQSEGLPQSAGPAAARPRSTASREVVQGRDLEAECERLADELARLGEQLTRMDAEREFLRLHAQNLEQDLRRVIHERDARTRELEAANQLYRLVVTSRSWRLMAPLRAIARALRSARSGKPAAGAPRSSP